MHILCQLPRLFVSVLLGILSDSGFVCPTLGMFWARQFFSSPASFLEDIGSSSLRGSDGCSGQNSVWMTNRAALFACYIQCFLSTVMVMMSLMKSYIDAYVAVMSTAGGSAFERWFSVYCLSSFGSKVLCGELILSVSQDFSLSRSFPRSIAASMVFGYYSGVGVVPEGNRSHRKAILSNIDVQVNGVVEFSWIRR